MIDTLHCPSCGAPLDYDPRVEDETMRCPFCESTVVLPERQRPAPQPQTRIVVERTGDENAVKAGVIVAFVVQSDKITRYEGTTGKALGVVASGGYDDVATASDGGLVTFAWNSRDDIARLDSSGRVTRVIRAAISGQTDESELNARVACDGTGQIYALGTFNNAVFKFSPDGKFLTQFGGDGDQPGQFRAPDSIAVDNQGRVYVGDFKGVQVFDSAGRYIGLIKVRGAASGLAFDDKNNLWVVARTQVYRFPPFNP